MYEPGRVEPKRSSATRTYPGFLDIPRESVSGNDPAQLETSSSHRIQPACNICRAWGIMLELFGAKHGFAFSRATSVSPPLRRQAKFSYIDLVFTITG